MKRFKDLRTASGSSQGQNLAYLFQFTRQWTGADGNGSVLFAERFFPRIRNGSTTFSLIRSFVDIPGQMPSLSLSPPPSLPLYHYHSLPLSLPSLLSLLSLLPSWLTPPPLPLPCLPLSPSLSLSLSHTYTHTPLFLSLHPALSLSLEHTPLSRSLSLHHQRATCIRC